MSNLRFILTNALLAGLAVAFLVHFGLILKYGSILIREPILMIMGLEVYILLGCLILVAYNVKKGRINKEIGK